MNKQAFTFLTLFTLVVLLGVYYVTLPADSITIEPDQLITSIEIFAIVSYTPFDKAINPDCSVFSLMTIYSCAIKFHLTIELLYQILFYFQNTSYSNDTSINTSSSQIKSINPITFTAVSCDFSDSGKTTRRISLFFSTKHSSYPFSFNTSDI